MASFIGITTSLEVLLIFTCILTYSKGDIVLQSGAHCGSYRSPLELRILDVDELEVYSHVGQQYYAPNLDCMVSIIGKTYHQWEIEILNLNMDDQNCEHYSPCCHDYLKIFNSYRVDNARLFPSIPWRGLCGNIMPRRTTFTSSQNFITIQFNSDPRKNNMRGFTLHMRQYPRRNSGRELQATGYIGGWNDGTLSELQIDWSEQELIPGDYTPGQNPTFDFDPNGVSCYECLGCQREYFDSSIVGVTTKEGCYVCTKEWLQGTGAATRQCLSKSMYTEKLLTFTDTSTNGVVEDFRDCRTFIRGVVGTTYVNLCVCDSEYCNKAQSLQSGVVVSLLISMIVALVLQL